MFVRIRCPPSRAHIAGKAKKNSKPYYMYWYIISRTTALKFSSRSGPGPYTAVGCTVYDVRCTVVRVRCTLYYSMVYGSTRTLYAYAAVRVRCSTAYAYYRTPYCSTAYSVRVLPYSVQRTAYSLQLYRGRAQIWS